MPGWTINLTKQDGTIVDAVTDSNGMYQFSDLVNGTYTVTELMQNGWINITPVSILVEVNGTDIVSKNFTNTLPPAQVTGLKNDTSTETAINLSWHSISNANYQVFRNGSSLGFTSNNYWNDTALTADTLYEYVVRANDSYNYWGPNSSSLFVRTAPARDITAPASITNLSNVSYAQNYINWTWSDPADQDFYRVIVFIDGIFKDYLLKGIQFYNATGFDPNTGHTISTRTEDTSGNINQTWKNNTAMTAPVPVYRVSGYVFDNYGNGLKDVLVQNGSYNAMTLASGYYSLSVYNGTFNFSYTKSGFNHGYLVVAISGASNNSANITILDMTPPAQVTGLKNDTPTRIRVNLSWNSVSDANYYQVFRNGSSIGYTRNNYWNDTALTADTLYLYVVRANDSYNNWGLNSSGLYVRTGQLLILQADIRIEPQTLNLASKGEITAFIKLPSGYDVSNIVASTIVCEGAHIVKWNIAADKTFIAKFNTQDLVNVVPGDAVKVTVTGNLINGTPFEGTDTIRVRNKKDGDDEDGKDKGGENPSE
ncbi:Carboxypeptidase regulatory-like domain protein [uncultured archaeon]|nr:Carboxypeptidase regulatory-like domain protein [uncultured archaeon]